MLIRSGDHSSGNLVPNGVLQHGRAHLLAEGATIALLSEAVLTPKPALVDRRGSGAHHDLSLALLERSAYTLQPWFVQMAQSGMNETRSQALRERLGQIGRAAEQAMLQATAGVNTHRGAIWALGLLVAAASASSSSAQAMCERAGAIARCKDPFTGVAKSNGSRVEERFGSGGARTEAQSGFPHVGRIGLKALHAARRSGIAETHARLDALLCIMMSLEDTCLLHRGGQKALQFAQSGAWKVLMLGGSSSAHGAAALELLHCGLLDLRASPGGAADMLAATLFADWYLKVAHA